MRNTIRFVLVSTVLGAFSCTSPKISVLTTFSPADKVVYPEGAAEIEKKYPGEAAVYLKRKTTYEYTTDKHILYEGSYILLDPDNKNMASFNLNVQSGSKLKAVSIRLVNPDGQVQIFGLKDLRAEKASDGDISYKLAYPACVKGTLIEENYEVLVSYGGLTSYSNVFIPYTPAWPSEILETRIIYPKPEQIVYKNAGTSRSRLETTLDPKTKKQIVVFRDSSVTAFRDEPYSPYFKETADYSEFYLVFEKFTVYKQRWSEIASSFNKFGADASSVFGLRVSSTSRKLTEGKTTEYEKAKAISDWVRDNIEPVNEYGVKDFDDVILTKKGNVFIITGLVLELLRKAGIKADYLLVHDQDEGPFDRYYVAYKEFTTPAVQIHLEGRDVYSIPYLKILPFGFFPDQIQGQPAMVVRSVSGGKGKKEPAFSDPDFITLPVQAGDQNRINEEYRIDVDSAGVIRVKEIKSLSGSMAIYARNQLKQAKESELGEKLKSFLTYTQGEVQISNQKIENLESPDSTLRLTLEYSISNLITVTPEEIIFQTGGLLSPASIKRYLVDDNNRHAPISIKADELYVKNITIKVPESWELVSDLKNRTLQNQFGTFNSTAESGIGFLKIRQERRLIRSAGDRNEFKALVDLTGSKSAFSVPNIIFKIKEGSSVQ